MFSPFFRPRKNRLQKCTLCPPAIFFHFVPIVQSGSSVKMWVPQGYLGKMTFSQISRNCESRLNGIKSGAPINTKMAAATVVGGKVPPTKIQKMLPL
ncbi:hypothetical protein CDAR_570081 [Caerostris darwini]|uniref:Uncharacterized protein n=1 Tax=Caerostris darwini TaxID=1538125 RepID=A0AAV4RXM9_9ARAC|nr:hypothetical protein CDAR_570081 [Caerostris darwini]